MRRILRRTVTLVTTETWTIAFEAAPDSRPVPPLALADAAGAAETGQAVTTVDPKPAEPDDMAPSP